MVTPSSPGKPTADGRFRPAVEQIDLGLGRFFEISRIIQPEARHLLYTFILGSSGDELVGIQQPKSLPGLSKARFAALLNAAAPIRKCLADLFRPTYLVASYWSPIDERRRSVIVRRPIAPPQRPYTLASAYAFYALTFAGRARDPRLTSVVQYTATQAPFKRGLNTCFDELPAADTVLHIPPKLDALITYLGVDACIEDLLSTCGPQQIEEELSHLLSGDSWQNQGDGGRFGEQLISEFLRRVETIPSPIAALVDSATATLRLFFGDDELQRQHGCMMLLTQVLWRQTCPSAFFYTFMDQVRDTCCVLTMGRDTPLTELQWLAGSKITSALFSRALLEDYAIMETNARVARRTNSFRRLLAHNLPKALIAPGTAEVSRIKRYSANGDDRLPDIADSAQRLLALFAHFENLLIAFGTPTSGTFSEPIGILDGDFISEAARSAFSVARERHSDSATRRELKIEVLADLQVPPYGHPNFIREILFNLIFNAVESIAPPDVDRDPDRAVVLVHASSSIKDDLPWLELEVVDRGTGMSESELMRQHDYVSRLQAAHDEEEFWKVVDEQVNLALNETAEEGHMGLGLLFCAAYLRSLEWHHAFELPGMILMPPKHQGTSVRVRVPQPRDTPVRGTYFVEAAY